MSKENNIKITKGYDAYQGKNVYHIQMMLDKDIINLDIYIDGVSINDLGPALDLLYKELMGDNINRQ